MKPALIAAVVVASVVYLARNCEAKQSASEIVQCSSDKRPNAFAATIAFFPLTNGGGFTFGTGSTWRLVLAYKPPEWVLPLIGIITAGFICWQSLETRKAAQASQKSAEATFLNAQALMDSNRAWVTVEPAEWHPAIRVFNDKINEEYLTHSIRINIKNRGQSPAQLMSASLKYILLENPLDSLPPAPMYDTPISVEGLILTPDNIAPDGYFSQVADLEPSKFIQQKDYDRLRSGEAVLLMYGFVIYGDIHKRECETRFSFYIEMAPDPPPGQIRCKDRWLHGGPSAYNRCT